MSITYKIVFVCLWDASVFPNNTFQQTDRQKEKIYRVHFDRESIDQPIGRRIDLSKTICQTGNEITIINQQLLSLWLDVKFARWLSSTV